MSKTGVRREIFLLTVKGERLRVGKRRVALCDMSLSGALVAQMSERFR
jgi:hypothetical protein